MNSLATNLGIMTIGNDKKKYNRMESVLQEIQKAIALSAGERTQHNAVVNEVLNTIIEELKAVDPLFKNIYQKNLYGGSYYDGLKLNSPDEYDIDLALKLPKEMNPCLEISDIAGFVKIRVDLDALKKKSNYAEYRAMEKFIDGSNHLLTEKFRVWFEGVVTRAKNNLDKRGSKYEFNFVKSGPAFTLKIQIQNKLVCVDLVPSIIFGNDKWPGSPFRKNVTGKDEFLVVPKTPLNCGPYNTAWRLSFQEQEKVIINGKNGLKDTIRLLKLLRNVQVQESSIPSYYIKTVMMLMIEDVPNDFWKNNSRSYIFMMGLKYFCESLENGKLPYYWNRNYNLLNAKKDITLQNWSRRIDKIFKTLEKKLDSPTLRSDVLKFFGQDQLLKNQSEQKIQKDMEEKLEADCDDSGVDLIENIEDSTVKNLVQEMKGMSIKKTLVNSLHTSPSSIESVQGLATNFRCTHESHLSLWRESTEHESFGINVMKKLEKMDTTQAIYAQILITQILGQGLLKQLTSTTKIDDSCSETDGFIMTPSSISLGENEVIAPPSDSRCSIC